MRSLRQSSPSLRCCRWLPAHLLAGGRRSHAADCRRRHQGKLDTCGARLAGAPRPGRDAEGVQPVSQRAAQAGRRCDHRAREGHHPVSARRQADGRLEEGRAAGPERLRRPFHGLPAAAGQRRQLLCLPPARQEGAELRHAWPEPAGVRQDPQVMRKPRSRPSTSGSTTRMPRFPARTCRVWAPASS